MKHKFHPIISLAFLLFSGSLQAYIWPTNAPKLLSGTFGETRAGHLHSGIDIKTWAQVGYECYAVEDGYISRIKESPGGYGKVLYLVLDDGNTAVYSHLDRFSGSLEDISRSIKLKDRTNLVDRYFLKNEIRVRKGSLIAYTGGSGTRYPHLHFELRNAEGDPVNPQKYGFTVEDELPPQPMRIALIPVGAESRVMGLGVYSEFSLDYFRNNIYVCPDTVQAQGRIQVDLQAFDQSASRNNNGVYQMTLYHQGRKMFHKQFDTFRFDETELISLDRDYRLAAHGRGNFQVLGSTEINRNFTPYDSSLTGIIDILPGPQTIVIQLRDANGNRSAAKLEIMGVPYPEMQTASSVTENFFILETDSLIRQERPQTLLLTRYNAYGYMESEKVLDPETDIPGGKIIMNLRDLEESILTLQYRDSLGYMSYPQFFHFNGRTEARSGDLQFRSHQYEDRVILEIFSEKPIASEMVLGLEREAYESIPLKRLSMFRLLSGSIAVDDLRDVKSFSIFQRSALEWEQRKEFTSHVIRTGEKTSWMSADSSLSLIYPRDCYYQEAFAWLEEAVVDPEMRDGELLSRAWHFYPEDIASRRGFSLAFRFDEDYPLQTDMGIYRFDPGGDSWSPVRLRTKEDDRPYIDAKGLNGGIFAVLRDTGTPQILRSSPGNGGRYRQKDLKIYAALQDELSGFGDGSGISVYIDGKWTVFYYNAVTGIVDVEPGDLRPGNHSIEWQIMDRAGNMLNRRVQFTIIR